MLPCFKVCVQRLQWHTRRVRKHELRESLQVNDHYRPIMANKENGTKKLLNNVLGVTEMTFLMKRAMFHPLMQRGCFWMEDNFWR